jgi:FkbM family methyltransferase
MKIQATLNLVDKLIQSIKSPQLTLALLRYRVLAGAEHRHSLFRNIYTVVDIGANRGQFALAARRWAPIARVIAFEPLPGPASVFRKVFSGDDRVLLQQAAIGPNTEYGTMHVSERDDSSSLLPISHVQTNTFPGTREVTTIKVRVAPLDKFVTANDLLSPAMLKLDVQGFELEALRGCESLLHNFEWVYCECSFIELYAGQKMASEVIDWLAARHFSLNGVYNIAYDHDGQAVQADFLFRNKTL